MDANDSQHKMSDASLHLTLEQIKGTDKIRALGITGGEPMTAVELVEKILLYDFKRPMQISLKTNGFWGANYDDAKNFIQKYRKSLSGISLSYDFFHKEFMPVEAIRNIINICWDFKVPSEVVGCYIKGEESPGKLLNVLGDEAFKTEYKYQPTFRTGLAKNIPDDCFYKLYKASDKFLPCVGAQKPSLLVDPNLDVFPCCSQIVQNTILRVGNLKENSLAEQIEMIESNKLLVSLFTKGLSEFVNCLDENDISESGYSAPCEICEALFATPKYLKRIYEKLQ